MTIIPQTITSATYTASAGDTALDCDASANDITITLPAIAGAGNFACLVQKIDTSSHTVTIVGDVDISDLSSAVLSIPRSWILILPKADRSQWLTKGIDELYIADKDSVMSFIPKPLWAAILAGTSTVDVSSYFQAWLTAGGERARRVIPAGQFLLGSEVAYNSRQTITGAGPGTRIVQPAGGSNNLFVALEWQTDSTHPQLGPLFEDITFVGGSGTTGGYAIVNYNFKDQIHRCVFSYIGILLTTDTKNGYHATGGATQNHRIVHCNFDHCALGAIYTDTAITDTFVTSNGINNCGSTTRAAIDAYGLAGWQILDNKIFSCPGIMIQSRHAFQNMNLIGNNLDYDCTQPLSTMNYGMKFSENIRGGLVIADNIFRLDVTDATQSYTMLYVDTGTANGAIVHSGNRYSMEVFASFTGSIAPDASGAATLTVSSTLSGTIAVNQYVRGKGVAPGTRIVSGSGPTYQLNGGPQTVALETMTATIFGAGSDITAFAVSDVDDAFGVSGVNHYDGYYPSQYGSGETAIRLNAVQVGGNYSILQPATNALLGWLLRIGAAQPTRARIFLYDDMFTAIGPDILAKLDLFYVLAAADTTIAGINLANPGRYTLAENNTLSFTADGGYQSVHAGSTYGYLDTGVAGTGLNHYTTVGTDYTGSMFVWCGNNMQNAAACFGQLSTNAGSVINPSSADPTPALITRAQSNTQQSTASPSSLGMFGWSRLAGGGGSYTQYVNGNPAATSSSPTTLGTTDFIFCGHNGNYDTLRVIQGGLIGAGLTDAEVQKIYCAVRAYLVAIGAPVGTGFSCP